MRLDAFNAVGGRAKLLSSTCQLPIASSTVLKPALVGNISLPFGKHIVLSGGDE